MSSAAPGGGSAAAAAAEATAAAAPAAARINHSKLVVGSMYSFSTEGCPNVTITSKKIWVMKTVIVRLMRYLEKEYALIMPKIMKIGT
jgi:hypothetical protein